MDNWKASNCAKSPLQIPCLQCMTCLVEGIVYCDCGTCLMPSGHNTKTEQREVRRLDKPLLYEKEGSKQESSAWPIRRSESPPSSKGLPEECDKERIQFYPSSISGFRNLPKLADRNRMGLKNSANAWRNSQD